MKTSLFRNMKNTTLRPSRLEPKPHWSTIYKEEIIIVAMIVALFILVLIKS